MTRKKALEVISSYVAQGDMAAATRVYCEHGISRKAYDAAIEKGRSLAAMVASRG